MKERLLPSRGRRRIKSLKSRKRGGVSVREGDSFWPLYVPRGKGKGETDGIPPDSSVEPSEAMVAGGKNKKSGVITSFFSQKICNRASGEQNGGRRPNHSVGIGQETTLNCRERSGKTLLRTSHLDTQLIIFLGTGEKGGGARGSGEVKRGG